MSYANIFNELLSKQTYIPLDIVEEDDKMIILAEVPGVNPEDLDVKLNFDSVDITVKNTRDEKTEEALNYIHQEIPYGTVRRKLTLNKPVNTEKASMKLNNGILILEIPYADEAKTIKLKIN